MKVLTATLALVISSPAAAQEMPDVLVGRRLHSDVH
jgi:hypothetical protein